MTRRRWTDILTLRARDGRELTVALTPGAKPIGVSKTDIKTIKSGSLTGCAAAPDGMPKVLEVTVFPASIDGAGEGSYAWDLGSISTMTNGTVGDLVMSSGQVMTAKYNDVGSGEKKTLVLEDVPIVNLESTDKSLLVVGAHFIVVPTRLSTAH